MVFLGYYRRFNWL